MASVQELLQPLSPGGCSAFVFFNWLMLAASLALAVKLWRGSAWSLVRPAAMISLLLAGFYQLPLALYGAVIDRALPNAWLLGASVHVPVFAGLVWCAMTPRLGVAPARAASRQSAPESAATFPAILAVAAGLTAIYLGRLGWECCALYALLHDPELTLLAREFSIKFLGFSLATVAYGALANVVCPVLAFLGFTRLQDALGAGQYLRAITWAAFCIGTLLIVLLPGAKGMLLHTIVVGAIAAFLVRPRLRDRLLIVAQAGLTLGALMVGLEILKERGDGIPTRRYDVVYFMRRHQAEAEVRVLLDSLKFREDSLGITRSRLDRIIASLDIPPASQEQPVPTTSVGKLDRPPEGLKVQKQNGPSLSERLALQWTRLQEGAISLVSRARQGFGRVISKWDRLPARAKRLLSRVGDYAPAIWYRGAVVPLQAASWHYAHIAQHGPPGREALPFAKQLFGRSIDMTSLVYQEYGSVYAAGDRTATATAPTTFIVAYPAYFGIWGFLMVLAALATFDIAGAWVLRHATGPVLGLAVGLIFTTSLNFMISDFVTTVLSHGGAAALSLLLGVIWLERHPVDARRLLDLVVAAVALVILLPFLVAVAALIRSLLGRPVLFRQARAGKNGRIFMLYKFRTMRDTVGADGQALPDSVRLTPVGRWLRSTSFDELPSLFNVLRGDITLVGPRPLLAEYLPLYSPEQARRHEIRPGITGWAQVNGRNALAWDEKFRLDVWYVDHRSFWLDVRILGLTVLRIFQRKGITQPGQATAERFTGKGESTSPS